MEDDNILLYGQAAWFSLTRSTAGVNSQRI